MADYVDTTLGVVGLLPVGTWNSTATYDRLNVVTYDGSSYVAKKDVPAGPPLSSTSFWQIMAEKGDKGDTGEIISASATITDSFGNPTVVVTAGGTTTERTFAFAFTGLRGDGISSIAKTGTSGLVDTYTITLTSGTTYTFTVTNGEVTNAYLEEVLEDYAKVDGYYEQLTSGTALQLLSNVKVEDQVPYNFRTSGGTLDIGDREEDEIHGMTVAWNQIAYNGNFADGTTGWGVNSGMVTASNNKLTYTAPANVSASAYIGRAINFVSGHKYLFKGMFNPSVTTAIRFLYDGVASGVTKTTVQANTRTEVCQIVSMKQDYNYGMVYVNADASMSENDTVTCENFNLTDLTLMFGSEIANYIYTLEQAEAGSGIAKLKSWGFFKKPYYAYNAGTLESVQVSAHKMTHFNQWDEEWEEGIYDITTGTKTSGPQIRCKNPIHILPSTNYYFNTTGVNNRILFYDANNNYTGDNQLVNNAIFTSPANAHFMTFHVGGTYGTTYNHDICINLHWDGERDGEYEEYKLETYLTDHTKTFRGIPKIDADGNLYADGDVYHNDGTVDVNYGIVDLGTLNYEKYDTADGTLFRTPVISGADISADGNAQPLMCSLYVSVRSGMRTEKTMSCGVTNKVDIIDSTYSTASAFKTAMSGVYLLYPLATPTTDTADPYTSPQIVDNWGTEEYTDYAYAQSNRDFEMPVAHKTLYGLDLKAKLETAPDVPSSDGYYGVSQDNGQTTYTPIATIPTIADLVEKEPDAPTEDGTYTKKVVVVSGVPTYQWVLDE